MNRWSKSGVLDQVLERLQREPIVRIKVEAVKMDSTTREVKRKDKRVIQLRMGDFRKTWWNVCVKAGLGRVFCRKCAEPVTRNQCKCGCRDLKYVGLLFHDRRRTAARNYRRLGVGETVIMRIGGWKTRSVFERCNIVTQADVLDAVTKLENAEQKQAEKNETPKSRFGHDSVTVTASAIQQTVNSKPF